MSEVNHNWAWSEANKQARHQVDDEFPQDTPPSLKEQRFRDLVSKFYMDYMFKDGARDE